MSRKKKGQSEYHERWLVSYADFITLLFAFFVVMYAISQADLEKLKKASESIQGAFGQSAMKHDKANQGKVDDRVIPKSDGKIGENQTSAETSRSMDDIKKRVEEALLVGYSSPSQLIKSETSNGKQILRVVIPKSFDKGAERAFEDALPIFQKIGKALVGATFHLEIHGHAGQGESGVEGGVFRLSANRASWLAEYLTTRFDVKHGQVTIKGYGQNDPIGSTPGDGMDRRVEILVME